MQKTRGYVHAPDPKKPMPAASGKRGRHNRLHAGNTRGGYMRNDTLPTKVRPFL